MRASSWTAALVVAGLCMAVGGHPPRARASGGVPARPPWPVFVGTSEGRFVLRPSGAVVRLSRTPWRLPHPRIPRGWIGPPHGPFGHIRDGHVVLTQGHETLWESQRTFDLEDHARLWDFTAWNFGVTFQIRGQGPLYASVSGCPEERIGRGLSAEGITRSGRLIALRRRSRTLQSWTVTMHRRKTLARGLSLRAIDASTFDRRTGTFLYWTRQGRLVRTDGVHGQVLADYHALGFLHQPALYLLRAGLLELLSRTWREVVLRPDGSVFARARGASGGSDAGFGDQVADRWGDAVAYAQSTEGRPRRSTVFLLRPGDDRGSVLYSGRGGSPCAVALSWREQWLLFAPSRGRPVILNATGATAPIELQEAIRAIPGHARQVRWTYGSRMSRSERAGVGRD